MRLIDDPKRWPVAGSAGPFDREMYPGGGRDRCKFPPELMVQLPAVALGQAAGVVNSVLTEPCHLVHVAQHSAALRFRQSDGAGIKSSETVWRELSASSGHRRSHVLPDVSRASVIAPVSPCLMCLTTSGCLTHRMVPVCGAFSPGLYVDMVPPICK